MDVLCPERAGCRAVAYFRPNPDARSEKCRIPAHRMMRCAHTPCPPSDLSWHLRRYWRDQRCSLSEGGKGGAPEKKKEGMRRRKEEERVRGEGRRRESEGRGEERRWDV
jgi:hypothetical protein